jgi:ankyrin repeat protein
MQDKDRDIALIAAAQEGHIECVTILLKHNTDINYQRKVRLLFVEKAWGRSRIAAPAAEYVHIQS